MKRLPLNPTCEFCKLNWFRIHTDYIQPHEQQGEDYVPCATDELVHLVPLVAQGAGR